MQDTLGLSAVLRQTAAGLTSAAAAVGRVLESVADAIESDADRAPAPRSAAAKRKRGTPSSTPARTRKSTAQRDGHTSRGRRSST